MTMPYEVTDRAWYHGNPGPSDLPATHPEFAYFSSAPDYRLLLFGRPLRVNFYVYKLPADRGRELGEMLDRASDDQIYAFAEKHEIRWTQRVNPDGYEVR